MSQAKNPSDENDRPDISEIDRPDLPDGWSWWSASASSAYYTQWFGTDYRMGGPKAGDGKRLGGYDGEIYWDLGGNGKHKVRLYAVVGIRDDDPVISEYPDACGEYDTAEEAYAAVPGLIRSLWESEESGGGR